MDETWAHGRLDLALTRRDNGTMTEEDKSLLMMSTDSAGQEKLCREWGIPFPGAQITPPNEDPNEGNTI